MAKFRMTRIKLPKWARPPRTHFEDVDEMDQKAIQKRQDRMLRVVHNAVEAYLNDPQLCFEGEENVFPKRSRLTGEYYIGDEWYKSHAGPPWFQIIIWCRCLEGPKPGMDRDDDYLGLAVWLRCEPGKWTFSVEATDPSSI